MLLNDQRGNPMKFVPWIALAVVLIAAAGAGLQLRKFAADEEEFRRAWGELVKLQVPLPERFDPGMVSTLPEPARRFFLFAIKPGARLSTVLELTMQGELSLGTKDDPKFQPMRAEQVLAAPHGLVWRIESGSGLMRFAGSDGMVKDRSWTRFWLLRVIPVVRVGGDADHLRSSFGRVVAEAAFWTPAFLLPREGVAWSAVDDDTARVTVTQGAREQAVDIRVHPDGRPAWVAMQRWTNANSDKVFRLQPFGGKVSDFREVEGVRIPFRVDGGNFFGTPDYFPFYKVRVVQARFRYAPSS